MATLRNEWHGIGRFTRDPELKRTNSNIPVVNFSLAVDRPGTNKDNRITDFIDFVAWRQSAELICKYMHKGDPIGIVGYLITDEYTDQNGNKRRKLEVMVDSIEFMPGRRQQESQGQAEPEQTEQSSGGFAAVETDELPF